MENRLCNLRQGFRFLKYREKTGIGNPLLGNLCNVGIYIYGMLDTHCSLNVTGRDQCLCYMAVTLTGCQRRAL